MSEESLSEQQAEELVRGFSESRMTIPNFFNNVVKSIDTTKTGNLSIEELGMPKLPVRTYKEISLFSNEVANQKEWGDYFTKMAEIHLATSLSKEALLLKLAVTTKKELSDLTPTKKKNRGWFGSKKEESPSGVPNA